MHDMRASTYDVAIIGGGIIGLATALQLLTRAPRTRLAVLEKEERLAVHQTGHNSGVIHSGIYYRPGSQKAQFCVRGVGALLSFCDENEIPYELCGKLIVATQDAELPRLEELHRRGLANGVKGLEVVEPERIREIEPHATGIRALYAPRTGIIDYGRVARAYAEHVQKRGGDIVTGARAVKIAQTADSLTVETTKGAVHSRRVINCGGLQADRIARMMGVDPGVRIVPFRGDYFVLRAHARGLVQGLIYPAPDPRFPFLGVHFTKTIHGGVEAGPNAVLSLAREGYGKWSFNAVDALGTVTYPGFWKMARRYWRIGVTEVHRAFGKAVFVRDLQRLVPAVTGDDVEPGGAGLRAQALNRRGELLDDFSIQTTERAIHVLNAPSPGATSSLAIGEHLAGLAMDAFGLG